MVECTSLKEHLTERCKARKTFRNMKGCILEANLEGQG